MSPSVIVSSGGVYHAYHAARGALKTGYLKKFIAGIVLPGELDSDYLQPIRLPNYVGHAIQQIPNANSQFASYLMRDNLFDLWAKLHIEPADVFHGWNHMSLYSMRKAKQLGAKTIIERSSAHPVVQQQILQEEWERFGLKYPTGMRWLMDKHVQEYEEADAIAVCSEFVARTLTEHGVPEAKLRRVHLGFDPSRFSTAPKTDDVFRVIFAGMIGLRKGIPYLLQAFQKLNLPNSELILVGGFAPESREFMPKFDGLYRHIAFVPQRELARLYQQSSVLVMPSLEDGFGMTVYEAAACGIPSIVSENTGAALEDGKSCFIVPIRDSDALAERLLWLYEHQRERLDMGEAARQHVQQYTWDTYHEELKVIYDELAAST